MNTIKTDAVGGIITFWTLAEFTDRNAVVQGFGANDLAQFVPEPQEPVTILKNALTNVVAGRTSLIRPLAKRSGWAVVGEDRGQEQNQYQHIARAEVTQNGSVLVVPTSSAWTPEQTDAVYREFTSHSGMIPGQRMASSLVSIAYSLGGIRVRPTGGIYYLPADKTARWQEAAAVVEKAGRNAVYILSQELNPNTVRAIKDALVNEVEAASRRLHEEIMSGELGERAVATRVAEVGALQAKVAEYEKTLGVGLDTLRQQLDAVGTLRLTGTLIAGAEEVFSL